MAGKWVRHGRICAPGDFWWNQSYGILPTPQHLPEQNTIRIYFGGTDKHNDGRIGYLDTDASDPSRVLRVNPEPVLDLGVVGAFDDCGVVPNCLLAEEDRTLLYTIGFQRCEKVPSMLFAGLATQPKGSDAFERVSQAPILPRQRSSYLANSAPCVIKDEQLYRMWCVTVESWKRSSSRQYMTYSIGYAESNNGVDWNLHDRTCLQPQGDEFGLARPWVVKGADAYEMWFSGRTLDSGGNLVYKGISKAVSDDGLHWNRLPGLELGVSAEGWDSEMTCYGAVIEVNGQRLMYYCGNGNGKTGFGLASWSEQ